MPTNSRKKGTEELASYLREHPAAMTKIDTLGAILREQTGVDMAMYLVPAGEEPVGAITAGVVLCCDRIPDPTIAFVVRPDGTGEQVLP